MNKVTGGTLPAQTWKTFMTAASKGMPVRPLAAPPPGLMPPSMPEPGGPVVARGPGWLESLFGGRAAEPTRAAARAAPAWAPPRDTR
jgi:penicillin-binding protein 1A